MLPLAGGDAAGGDGYGDAPGEGMVMEKAYDLRARLYCRNGNSFITSDSKVLTGIKDTRRPQLFVLNAPTNSFLNERILGVESDFSPAFTDGSTKIQNVIFEF